jgi:hypothetical protein
MAVFDISGIETSGCAIRESVSQLVRSLGNKL